MNSPSCSTCIYAERIAANSLRCRRSAPLPTELGNPLATHWPTVGAGDWCGEWCHRTKFAGFIDTAYRDEKA